MPVQEEPKFINSQPSAVGVYDDKGKKIYVAPYERRDEGVKDAVYIVSGKHFEQFSGPAGPLKPFPVPAVVVAAPEVSKRSVEAGAPVSAVRGEVPAPVAAPVVVDSGVAVDDPENDPVDADDDDAPATREEGTAPVAPAIGKKRLHQRR